MCLFQFHILSLLLYLSHAADHWELNLDSANHCSPECMVWHRLTWALPGTYLFWKLGFLSYLLWYKSWIWNDKYFSFQWSLQKLPLWGPGPVRMILQSSNWEQPQVIIPIIFKILPHPRWVAFVTNHLCDKYSLEQVYLDVVRSLVQNNEKPINVQCLEAFVRCLWLLEHLIATASLRER